MESSIRQHIEALFEDAPQSRKAYELREEMIQNLVEKYHDLVAEGKPADVAYNIAISSIGDISELFNDLEDGSIMNKQVDPQAQKKSALLTSIAVMIYILCPVPPILFSEFRGSGWSTAGVLLMFVMIAGATGLIIYNNQTKPRYNKLDDSMVEEFREYRSRKSEQKSIYGAINGAMWSLIVALYFIISFYTMAWHVSWVIFLIGGAISSLLRIFTTRN